LFVLVSFCNGLFASAEPDSLDKIRKPGQSETEAQKLLETANNQLKSNDQAALEEARQAEKLARSAGNNLLLAQALKLQGNIFYNRKAYRQAAGLYQSGLSPAQKSGDAKIIGDIYNNLGQSYLHTKDYVQSAAAYLNALVYRKTLTARTDEISTYNNLGQVYWEKQQYKKAVESYQQAALQLDNINNPRLAATVLNNLGNAYSKSGEMSKALDAYLRSLQLKKSFGTLSDLAAANANLGNVFYLNEQYEQAINHYRDAESLYLQADDELRAMQMRANLAVVYNELKDFDSALKMHLATLKYFETSGQDGETAKTLNNIGNLYQAKNDYPTAIDYYRRSLQIKEKLGDTEGMAVTYNNIGELQFKSGEFADAAKATEKSLACSKKLANRQLLTNNYRQLAKIYATLGDFRKAYQTQGEYLKLDSELYSKESRDVMAEMMARYDAEEKAQVISQLRTESQLQKQHISRQLRDKLRLISVLVVLALFILILLYFYRQKMREVGKRKAIQAELESLNQELEQRIKLEMEKYDKQQQIIVQKSKLEALGKLAAGIAHEINQPLSALTMSLDNLQNRSGSGTVTEPYIARKCQNMQEDIQRIRLIIDNVRQFSRDQQGSVIEQIEVNSVIGSALDLYQKTLQKAGIRLETHLESKPLYTVGNRFKLEQVILNMLSNAKDAIEENQPEGKRQGLVKLTTQDDGEMIRICVEDNGKGIDESYLDRIFDPFYTTKEPDKGTGLGLSISFGIIQEMFGSIVAARNAKGGMTMTINIPLLRRTGE